MGNGQSRRQLEAAGVRVQNPAHQRQEAGLAAAVLPGDADLFTAKQAEVGVGEQHPGSAPQGHIGEIQHAAAKVTRQIGRQG